MVEKLDDNEYYYLINKNIIINLEYEINNKRNDNIGGIINEIILKQKIEDSGNIQNILKVIFTEFKHDYTSFFKNDYGFSNIKFKGLLPNNREAINKINNSKIIYPSNFILIKPIIYEYLVKLIEFEDAYSNNNYEDLKRYSVLFSGNQIYLKKIKDEKNIIFVGEKLNNENKNEFKLEEEYNISYILIYHLKNEFIKEYNLFIKNYDIENYIQKRQLRISINQTKSIINDEKEEIGFFINLKKGKDLILEDVCMLNENENNDDNETIDLAFNNNTDNNIITKKSKNIDINNENKDNMMKANNKNDLIRDLIIKGNKDSILDKNINGYIKDLIIEDDNDSISEKNINNNNNDLNIKGDKDLIIEKNNDIDDSIIKGDIDLLIENNKNEENIKDSILRCDKKLIFENNINSDNLENVNKKNFNKEKNLIIEMDKKEENGKDEDDNNDLIIKGDKDLILFSNKNGEGEDLENANEKNNNNNLIALWDEKEEKGKEEEAKEGEKKRKNKNEEKNKPKLVGLINIKNQSSVNSLLQCMYNLPQLTHYFISNKLFNFEFEKKITNNELNEKEKDLNENIISKNCLSYKYYEVIYYLYYKMKDSKIIKAYSPNNFLDYIEKAEPSSFNLNKIIDPKTFFIFMISKIKKELNKKENLKDIDNLELNINSSIQTNVDNSLQLYKNYLKDFKYKNNSIIDNFFFWNKRKNCLLPKM